ncbi:short chain dehydrogenase [Photobacterium jeanii]|uniref:Short chain dehydrogenase n=1 Tax=Photobacterium jeanii TaxID=858640 RepID=A0A178K7Q9_9GAMM|nr:short chain dehydrogenase [Photobacterium jeanii]OAN13106.1 short chain dehydrogenase [Photobacterium jeanii]PST89256.1 short chain dehydrogenase [Photobacterium jeanii]
MKILAIGANGIIGSAVVRLLQQDHEVISVGHHQGGLTVDIENTESITALFETVGKVDAIICMAGNGEMGSLQTMPESGFLTVLHNKVMGQVNLARIGLAYLTEGGSITLTSGQAANILMPNTSAIAMGVAAIDAFVATAALELDSGKRINAVSPSMVKETMEQWGVDSSTGIPANDVALHYQASIQGTDNGKTFNAIPSN